MINLYFPASHLNEENQGLLEALFEDFGIGYDEDEPIDINYAIETLAIDFIHRRSIALICDEENCTDFDYTISELANLNIPFDIKYDLENDENMIGIFRKGMQNPEYYGADSFFNPKLSINKIREIIDTCEESVSDTEILNNLISLINRIDYKMEGNRLEDFCN